MTEKKDRHMRLTIRTNVHLETYGGVKKNRGRVGTVIETWTLLVFRTDERWKALVEDQATLKKETVNSRLEVRY